MSDTAPLPHEFYNRPALVVARQLLGMQLVREEAGQRIVGTILETEAYRGEEDLACHCRFGRTPRTQVMYGTGGFAYVYFTYGMHWMLNFVAEGVDSPAAVLIRSLSIQAGQDLVASRRLGQPPPRWTDGPGKICQALNIDKRLNGADLCNTDSGLFVIVGEPISDSRVAIGPRVGLNHTPEPWKSIPWRFLVQE